MNFSCDARRVQQSLHLGSLLGSRSGRIARTKNSSWFPSLGIFLQYGYVHRKHHVVTYNLAFSPLAALAVLESDAASCGTRVASCPMSAVLPLSARFALMAHWAVVAAVQWSVDASLLLLAAINLVILNSLRFPITVLYSQYCTPYDIL